MLVFVYGSLKRGESNAAVMRGIGAKYQGNAIVRGFALYDLGAFPAAVDAAGNLPVYGEVYEVNAVGLNTLDRFEGVPALYERKEASALLTDRIGYVEPNIAVAIYVMREADAKSRGTRIGASWSAKRAKRTAARDSISR